MCLKHARRNQCHLSDLPIQANITNTGVFQHPQHFQIYSYSKNWSGQYFFFTAVTADRLSAHDIADKTMLTLILWWSKNTMTKYQNNDTAILRETRTFSFLWQSSAEMWEIQSSSEAQGLLILIRKYLALWRKVFRHCWSCHSFLMAERKTDSTMHQCHFEKASILKVVRPSNCT